MVLKFDDTVQKLRLKSGFARNVIILTPLTSVSRVSKQQGQAIIMFNSCQILLLEYCSENILRSTFSLCGQYIASTQ